MNRAGRRGVKERKKLMSVACVKEGRMMKKFLVVFVALNFMVVQSSSSSDLEELRRRRREEGVRIWRRRGLKSFKEKATGTNTTFDCSPSGPCVPCLYHEKKDVSYRCSETGYRIPMRCVKTAVDEEKGSRNLLEDSSTIQVGPEMYVTYRSCIPALNQEKLSLVGFEAIMLLLLISSSFVIFRRKGSLVMPGAIRLPTNPRF